MTLHDKLRLKLVTTIAQSIPSKAFTSNSTKGFTLVELIIGGVVSLIVLIVTLGLVVEQRRLFLGDQNKIDFNQNLRAASEFIGTDIKQAGERVSNNATLPIIRLISGATASDPDALILQRNLLSDELTICTDVTGTATEILVADEASGTCEFSDGSTPADNLDDSVGEFKTYRCALDGTKTDCNRGNDDTTTAAIATEAACDEECVYAYIQDPATNAGEYFIYTDETYTGTAGSLTNRLQVIPLGPGGTWINTYTAASNPRIYILEEKKYGLCDGVLQVTTNRRPDFSADCPFPATAPQPIRLVDQIDDLQFRVRTSAGWQTTFNENLASLTNWQEVESIEIMMETNESELINTTSDTLTLTTEFYPRNVRSSDS